MITPSASPVRPRCWASTGERCTYLPKPVSDVDRALMRRIDELYLEHPFRGARMLRRQLRQEGVKVGRRHVATLMKKMGIEALAPQPGTRQRAPEHKIYPYLLRNVATTTLSAF